MSVRDSYPFVMAIDHMGYTVHKCKHYNMPEQVLVVINECAPLKAVEWEALSRPECACLFPHATLE